MEKHHEALRNAWISWEFLSSETVLFSQSAKPLELFYF